MSDLDHIRNFSIIAHIDHGKSSLADCILQHTGAVSSREMQDQFLDTMDIERERGITIKSQTVRLSYKAKDGETYTLNLIDTPGHVDFAYEVRRSLQACEGALLIVDASQGVEAQTVANIYLAIDESLELIPVLNKIDLPAADPDRARSEIEEIGIDASEAILASAKKQIGIENILEAIVQKIPAPVSDPKEPLSALIFDSWFDPYQGVIILCRVYNGTLKKGQKIRLMHAEKDFEVIQTGFFQPKIKPCEAIGPGEVGALICGIKDISVTKVGDTITDASKPAKKPLRGFQEVMPMVFCGFYPIESNQYEALREALEKLRLNDASISWEKETSAALGFGYRCGFLGLLHMEIVQERLEREFNIDLITTAPSVVYRITTHEGEVSHIQNPADLPPMVEIAKTEEPFIEAHIHVPNEFVGNVIAACEDKRGEQIRLDYVTSDRVDVVYHLPLAEMVFDFYDKLKSVSKGYASLDYQMLDYRESKLMKLDILINGDPVDALSTITHRDKAYYRGRELAKKLKETISRQMFEVAIQAAVGNKVIARETVAALRKNVTAKCYGGDISRKRKLLEKQKEGKKRMKQVGSIEIPQDAFLAVLKVD
jgi:GTP-binding protein LepA